MARSNTLEHSADHRDETAEYAASARNNDWNNSDFGEKFLEELKAINGNAAAAFDKQENLAEVRMAQRITLVEDLILNHRQALDERAIITVTSGRIRISRQQLR